MSQGSQLPEFRFVTAIQTQRVRQVGHRIAIHANNSPTNPRQVPPSKPTNKVNEGCSVRLPTEISTLSPPIRIAQRLAVHFHH
jgi:hypothetical protein